MSYDLILLPGKDPSVTREMLHDLKSRLDQVEAFRFCEVLDHEFDPSEADGDQLLFPVCLTRDAEVVEEAFAQLKLIVREYGLTLDDPQAGVPIVLYGTDCLPPMYGGPAPSAPEPEGRQWWRFW